MSVIKARVGTSSIKARVGPQNVVKVLSNNAGVPRSVSLINLADVNTDLKTQDGMILVWDLQTQTFIMTSVIDSSSTTIEGIAYFENDTNSTLPTNGALVVSGGVGIGKDLNVGSGLKISGISTFASDLDINAAVDILNGLTVSGASTFASDVNVNGQTTLNNLSVSGLSTFSGITTTGNDLYVGSNLFVKDDLYVSGTSELNGDVEIDGDLSIVGFISVTNGLYYEFGDYNPPNGIGYFDNAGKLVSSASTANAIDTSNYILTTLETAGIGTPVWTSTINGGEY
jgi:hypothetical protein